MKPISERMDLLEGRLRDEKFRSSRGLSGEVSYYVFDYDPKDELTVRAYFESLKSKADVPYRLVERDLYKIFLHIHLYRN